MRSTVLLALALTACKNEGSLVFEPPDLELTLDSPTYGAFLGDGPVEVRGHVSPRSATLTLDGEPLVVDADGTFTVDVPFDYPYEIVDVKAELGEQAERVRVPVFRGRTPMETWPGGATMRLTPGGLDEIGKGLGAAIDATGWDQQLGAAFPPVNLGFLTVTPVGIEHDPTVVQLIPHDEGIDTLATLVNVALVTEVSFDLAGTPIVVPARFVYDEIAMGAVMTPGLDDGGVITLSLHDSDIIFGTPSIEVTGLGGLPLDFLLAGLTSLIEPFGEQMLDQVLGQFDQMELGGPFEFETDLMGSTLAMRLSELYTDPDGVAMGLGIGLGEPVSEGPLGIPAPIEPNPSVHFAMGLHEAILDQVLSEQVLGLVTQDLDLGGVFGNVIGAGITSLPGGDDAPDGEGWCLSVNPGTAHVVRMQEGIAPFAALYLPDTIMDVGVMDEDGDCDTWLKASLAMEVHLNVRNGTEVGIAMSVREGAVLEYGADEGEWTEQEVVDGLGRFLVGSLDLFAGQLSFDLADLLGGGLGGLGIPGLEGAALAPKIVSNTPMTDEDGVPIEGLYSLGLTLFAE
jgi:hypothetical protein